MERASITIDGRALTVPMAEGQTVLEAVRAAGGNPGYSCQSGFCGACRAQLRQGDVHLRARMALSDEDVASGAILTCQAVAKTPELSIAFD